MAAEKSVALKLCIAVVVVCTTLPVGFLYLGPQSLPDVNAVHLQESSPVVGNIDVVHDLPADLGREQTDSRFSAGLVDVERGEDWFVPAKLINSKQLAVLAFCYMYALYRGAEMISDGSELLLLVPECAGLVGSLVIPMLGSVPEGVLILVSGMGPREDAQKSVSVGVGTIAGSTILLLTLPWSMAVWRGAVPIVEGVAQYAARTGGDASPSRHISSPTNRGCKTHDGLTRPGLCIRSGVGISKEVRRSARMVLLTSGLYLTILLPSVVTVLSAGVPRDQSAMDSQAASVNPWAFVAMLASFSTLFAYIRLMVAPPTAPAPCEEMATPVDDWKEAEEDVYLPDDLLHLPYAEQQLRIRWRSARSMGGGALLVLIFSDPMVGVLEEAADCLGVSPFYVSFVLGSVVSNVGEVFAAYAYSGKRTQESITVALTTLLGSTCMNNTLLLAILFGIVWARKLAWTFLAQTLGIMSVQAAVGLLTICKRTQTRVNAIAILSCYPLGLLCISVLSWAGLE